MFPLFSIPFLPEAVGNTVLLVGSFLMLLLGAEIFTNGVEWLGHRLGVSESATGSILAAVGTALPETMIPVIAILGYYIGIAPESAKDEVGVGAILGAPFMLATIAMFLIGVSVLYFSRRRMYGREFHFNVESTERDLTYFLVGYTAAFVAALLPPWLTPSLTLGGVTVEEPVAILIGLGLVALYATYVYRTLQSGELIGGDDLDELYLGQVIEQGEEPLPAVGLEYDHSGQPGRNLVLLQTLFALGIIIGGAHLFVEEVRWAAQTVGIPTAVVALLLAPLATELPEKFNSVIWISQDKDTLAIGNITGAMAFQGTLPVTLGIVFTSWNLTLQWGTEGFLNALSAILAIGGGGLIYLRARSHEGESNATMAPVPFLIGGLFYLGFIVVVVYHVVTLGVSVTGGH